MKTPTPRRPQAGFTLYELLITTIIVGVVMTYGIANMSEFTRNSRLTAAVNDLHASFYMARSEAARARTNITICASVNPMDANPNCGGTFESGWIVFVDNNGDVVRDVGEAVLRRHDALDATVSISTPGMDHYFSYGATGLGRGTVGGLNPPVTVALVCDDRGNVTAAGGRSSARALVVTPLGRATVLNDKNMIQTQIDNTGAACP